MIVVDPLRVPEPGIAMTPASAAAAAAASPEPSPGEASPFGGAGRTSHSDQSVPLGGVPRALREAAEHAGLDPLAELYNEALRYAAEGHLRLARERLQMLLCMAPDDGESRLMLARVHVAGQRWQEAIAALDEAQNCGMSVPMNLRRAVEDHLQAEAAAEEEQRAALRAREQGEVKSLRADARRLRSENAQLTGRAISAETEAKKWAWATAAVSGAGVLFLALSLLLGGSESPVEVAAAPEIAEEGTADDADGTPPEGVRVVSDAGDGLQSPNTATTAARAANALSNNADLDGTSLELALKGDVALLSGQVITHRQRKVAEELLMGESGINAVNLDDVELLARTQGTTYKVRSGDTLGHIAYEHYGRSALTKPIEKANKVNSKNLKIGQNLTIPAID